MTHLEDPAVVGHLGVENAPLSVGAFDGAGAPGRVHAAVADPAAVGLVDGAQRQNAAGWGAAPPFVADAGAADAVAVQVAVRGRGAAGGGGQGVGSRGGAAGEQQQQLAAHHAGGPLPLRT